VCLKVIVNPRFWGDPGHLGFLSHGGGGDWLKMIFKIVKDYFIVKLVKQLHGPAVRTCLRTQRNANIKGFCLDVGGGGRDFGVFFFSRKISDLSELHPLSILFEPRPSPFA